MPALNFKTQFAPLVESGKKKQTIRQVRKHPIKVGDTLYLYTGMRTKQCRKLREVICTKISEITILASTLDAYMNGKYLRYSGFNALARKDGFYGATYFHAFFRKQYGLPFEGVLIEWA